MADNMKKKFASLTMLLLCATGACAQGWPPPPPVTVTDPLNFAIARNFSDAAFVSSVAQYMEFIVPVSPNPRRYASFVFAPGIFLAGGGQSDTYQVSASCAPSLSWPEPSLVQLPTLNLNLYPKPLNITAWGNYTNSTIGQANFVIPLNQTGNNVPSAGFYLDLTACAKVSVVIDIAGSPADAGADTLNLAGFFSDTNPGALPCPYDSGNIQLNFGGNNILYQPGAGYAGSNFKVCGGSVSNVGAVATTFELLSAKTAGSCGSVTTVGGFFVLGSPQAAAPSPGVLFFQFPSPLVFGPGTMICAFAGSANVDVDLQWGFN